MIYHLLFKASAETTLTIAADRKHLGARIGFMSVLHTWGSARTTTRMSIWSCRVAAWRRMGRGGSRADRAIF